MTAPLDPDRVREVGKRLPDGLVLHDGVIMYNCESCGELTDLPVDPAEYEHGHFHNVCGRSPRCCP